MMNKLLNMVGLAVRAGKVRFGVYLTEKAILDGSARLVVAADDLGKDNRKKIEYKCAEMVVPLITGGTKSEIGRAVGKGETAVLCICDDSLAGAAIKIANSMPRKDGSPNE